MALIVDPGQWDVALIMSLGQMVVLANLEDGPERLFWNGIYSHVQSRTAPGLK